MEEEWFKVLVEIETLSGILHCSHHGEDKARSSLVAVVEDDGTAHAYT